MKTICILLLTISVVGCGGYGSGNGMGGGATPHITQLMPNTATPGQAFTLTVNGSNFTSGSVVFWAMTAKTPNPPIMAGQLSVAITSTDTACASPPCMVGVYVRTTGGAYGNGVNSNTVNFTVTP